MHYKEDNTERKAAWMKDQEPSLQKKFWPDELVFEGGSILGGFSDNIWVEGDKFC